MPTCGEYYSEAQFGARGLQQPGWYSRGGTGAAFTGKGRAHKKHSSSHRLSLRVDESEGYKMRSVDWRGRVGVDLEVSNQELEEDDDGETILCAMVALCV